MRISEFLCKEAVISDLKAGTKVDVIHEMISSLI